MPDPSDTAEPRRRKASRLRVIAEARLITRVPAPMLFKSTTFSRSAMSGPRIEQFMWCVPNWLGYEVYGQWSWGEPARCGVQFDLGLPPERILAIKKQPPGVEESWKIATPDRRRRI